MNSNNKIIQSNNRWKSRNKFNRLALNSAITATLFGGGYGYFAHAGTVTVTPSGTGTASGADGLSVTTRPGFGIDTPVSGGHAFELEIGDSLTFTNNALSGITGADNGIAATGMGGLSMAVTGIVTGGDRGIYAFNHGGDLVISANDVTGVDDGIKASLGSNGDNMFIAARGTVSGGKDGIVARHQGSGNLTISADDDVTGSGYDGISAYSKVGDGISITARGTVSGGKDGIVAVHKGGGDLIIIADEVAGRGEYLDQRELLKARLESGERFTRQGFERDADLMDIGVGVDLRNDSGFIFGLDIQRQIGSSVDTLSGSMHVRYNFQVSP